MRGTDEGSGRLFSYVDLESRVRRDHPLRAIRLIANEALTALTPDFSELYSKTGRPSIAPERLLRAMLLQAFYSVRSERQLMERLDTDLLFRWFVGLGIDDAVWDATVFSKNRDRLLEGAIAAKFLAAVVAQPRVKKLMSSDHFSVDGTLIEAWASMKSFKPKDGSGNEPPPGSGRNAEVDFKGEKRSNDTHASTTDPEARLYRKGAGMKAKLANRPTGITLGADKGYDARIFVNELRAMNVRPHVTQNTNGRRSAIDGRTTRHVGYAVSQRIRKRIEEAFGWMKTVGGQRQTKFRGVERAGWSFAFAAAAYNLIRLPKLIEGKAG